MRTRLIRKGGHFVQTHKLFWYIYVLWYTTAYSKTILKTITYSANNKINLFVVSVKIAVRPKHVAIFK